MIGENEIYLNQSTICAAVQFYLDSLMNTSDRVVVKSVEVHSETTLGYKKERFKVAIDREEAKDV